MALDQQTTFTSIKNLSFYIFNHLFSSLLIHHHLHGLIYTNQKGFLIPLLDQGKIWVDLSKVLIFTVSSAACILQAASQFSSVAPQPFKCFSTWSQWLNIASLLQKNQLEIGFDFFFFFFTLTCKGWEC